MNTHAAPAAALLVAISLTSCASASVSAPRVTVTQTVTASAAPAPQIAAATPQVSTPVWTAEVNNHYVEDARSSTTTFSNISDSLLIAFGQRVCRDLDAGKTPRAVIDEAFATLSANGASTAFVGDIGAVLGSATKIYCPSHVSALANAAVSGMR